MFDYHDLFNPDREQVEEFKARYRAGKIGDVEVKRRLAEALNEYLEPIRRRREEWMARPDDLRDLLREGTETAGIIARETIEEVKTRMGVPSLDAG